mgnify:FL=1|tara:strand:- start:278 stop:760 length:483 start_codon:yes stop_codon:yes gene_type:complete
MNISIIVAMSKNRVIGKDNDMPWHLSDDLKNFKKVTMGSTIIMGRLTYESIGKPLPKRKNIVLSRKLKDPNLLVFDNLDNALSTLKDEREIFIIGGEDIYCQTVNRANKIYLTTINEELEGDKYFPKIKFSNWSIIDSVFYEKNDNNTHSFKSEILIRNI